MEPATCCGPAPLSSKLAGVRHPSSDHPSKAACWLNVCRVAYHQRNTSVAGPSKC